jgi:membrane protein YdbS with pleckstrin-like domain
MIVLNTTQQLPSRAFWFIALRSLFASLLAVLLGSLIELLANAPGAVCRGALCGKLTGGQLAALIYLYAAFLNVRALLNFKWFSYVVTDHNISIRSGVFYQNTTAIRFDRIQDVRTIRSPLHMMLGLKSVAIWTASPDQRVGNQKRPDGLIVLEADEADELAEYLSNPQHSGAATAAGGAVHSPSSPGTAVMVIPGLIVLALLGLAVAAVLRKAPPATPSSAALTAPPAPAAPPAHVHPKPGIHFTHYAGSSPTAQAPPPLAPAGQPAQVSTAGYAIACAIHPRAAAANVTACADRDESRRCVREQDFPSKPTSDPAMLTLVNRSAERVRLYWLDLSGARALYASLPPGGHVTQQSHVGAHWLVAAQNDQCLGIFNAATMTVGIF